MTNRDPCNHESRKNIPWYVNGTLVDPAAVALREHLASCADCQSDLELHREMRAAVLGRELTPIMPASSPETIIGDGSDGMARRRDSRWTSSLLTRVAAGVAVIGVALVLTLYPAKDADVGNQRFETATSGGVADGIDYVLQLQFDESVSVPERGKIATELAGSVKWAVDASGVYEVHVRLVSPTLQDLKDYEEHVDTLKGVESAKFTALQLPMR